MRPSVHLLALAAIPVLAACNPTFDNFGKSYGTAVCTYAKECQESAFNDEYSSLKDCVEDQELGYDAQKIALQDCDFDAKRAADCIAETKKAARTCDDGDEASAAATCSKVFDCGSGAFDTSAL